MDRVIGGEGGIRTLDTFPYTHFPGVRLRPLGHLTVRARMLPHDSANSSAGAVKNPRETTAYSVSAVVRRQEQNCEKG